eukprot:g454.t1
MLQRRVAGAIAGGQRRVLLAGGVYRFNAADLNITGAAGLSFSAPAPLTLIFSPGYGVHFRDCANTSAGNWTIDYDFGGRPPGRASGLTYQLTNCSGVLTEDLRIMAAPEMAITAFLGGGGHVFRRVRYGYAHNQTTNRTLVWRDAMHFSDLRRGPVVEDSVVGFSGDDFFNVHATLLLVLECDEPPGRTCVLLSPHTTGAAGAVSDARPLYGGYSPLTTARAGDHLSFYGWPRQDMLFTDLGGGAAPVRAPIRRARQLASPGAELRARAAAAQRSVVGAGKWTQLTNATSVPLTWSRRLWRVELAAPLPAAARAAVAAPQSRGVTGPAIAAIDEMSCAGALLRRNTFVASGSNLGRFKSPGGQIVGNTFVRALRPNLELTALLPYFEGPVRLRGIVVKDNVFAGAGADPVHCGPLCEAVVLRGGENVSCMALAGTAQPCAACPDCRQATPWAAAAVANNSLTLLSRG